ncbi:AAA family ATPase, partial [Acidithiobacillus ferridurans]|nr:AAA family ATPase [Acidithiobacillus ferridurans]
MTATDSSILNQYLVGKEPFYQPQHDEVALFESAY